MADNTISQSRKKTDPSLRDLLDLHTREVMLALNCHAVGVIQSFNIEKQTAEITIAYKKTQFQRQSDGVYSPVLIDYPILLDVPCVVMGGGGGALTFPIAKGDECLVLFNDRDIDNWFSSGQVGQSVATPRLHALADGIAIVGVRSIPNALEDYDTERAVLRKGSALVGVGGGGGTKVKVSNDTRDLKTLLQNLITQIQAITVTCAAPGNPSSTPLNTAALNTISTQIAELLE